MFHNYYINLIQLRNFYCYWVLYDPGRTGAIVPCYNPPLHITFVKGLSLQGFIGQAFHIHIQGIMKSKKEAALIFYGTG